MQIDNIICPDETEVKLASKHGVTVRETRQVLLSQPRIRFAEKGYTEGGRYLSVFFVYKRDIHTAIVISARDMSKKERKTYGRK